MGVLRQCVKELWADERGISSVEYAILLSMIAGGIIFAAEFLSDAVSSEMTEAAGLFDDSCGNDGEGDGTGGGGSGQGGDNTC